MGQTFLSASFGRLESLPHAGLFLKSLALSNLHLIMVLPPITERDARKHPTQCDALSPWRRKQEQERTAKTGKNTQKSKSIVSPFSLLPPVGLFIEHDEFSFPTDFAQTGQ